MNNHDPIPAVGKVRRAVFVLVGLGFLGLAALGVFLPVLPTTPFVLLASYFFLRSHPPLHAWLLRSRLFGGLLRDWHRHRGVRPHVKFTAVAVLVLAVGSSAFFARLSWPWLVLLFALAAVGLVVILRLRTVRPEAEAEGS